MIFTGEPALLGVYETWQEPDERVQDDEENAPEPLLDHTMLPVGELPETIAVHMEEEPSSTGEGEQLTDAKVT